VPLDDLAAANGMRLRDVLLIGRRLKIPSGAQPPHPQQAASTPQQATSTPPPAVPPRHFTAADLAQMRSFCATYNPPTGPVGQLPPALQALPERLALRPLFVHWAGTYGVAPDLVEAIAWQESGWRHDAVSSADAQGIGQLLPQTAAFVNRLLGTNLKLAVADDNVRLEARFLAVLLQATHGRVCEAVASYFQGYATLQHIGVLPESQTYVRSVLALRPRFQ
jgi:soluble lytic murein transglycosylase-like protein